MGAVGQVLGADDKALFVFLCGAVGGRIVTGAFCYGHCVMSVNCSGGCGEMKERHSVD